MTYFLIFCIGLVVWLNRGRYDPSVPFLTLFFLKWVHWAIRNQSFFPAASLRFAKWIPWLFSILFLIRTDLLYVEPNLLGLSRAISFLPLFGMVIYTWGRDLKWVSLLFWILPLLATLFLSPSPHIDVFQSNLAAVKFFLQGINPYSATYPEIYKGEFDYHPGFLYWPGALYVQTLSQLIFHDIRAVLILAWICAAFLLKNWKSSIALWMTIPILAFGFEQAWLDPLIAFGGALTLYGLRKNNHLYWALGVVIAASVKQYGFMIGLFSVLYYALEYGFPKTRNPVLFMIGFFVLLMAPLVLWNPHDFLQMTIFAHTGAKIRPDALNFTAFWLKMTSQELPGILQLLAIITGLGLAIQHVVSNRVIRGIRVIPEAWAMFFGFSVFFGKFAFCNYFWLLLSFWILAESEGADKISNGQVNLQPSI